MAVKGFIKLAHGNFKHHRFWTNFEQKCAETLAELDNIQQKVVRVSYNC